MSKKILKINSYLIFLFYFVFITSCSTSEITKKSCYNYEKVAIKGMLVALPHPNGKGDYWIIKTAPFCTQVTPDEELYEEYDNQTEIHLSMGSLYSKYRHLVNRKIIVYGDLFSSHTGHHLRKILIAVDKIQEVK